MGWEGALLAGFFCIISSNREFDVFSTYDTFYKGLRKMLILYPRPAQVLQSILSSRHLLLDKTAEQLFEDLFARALRENVCDVVHECVDDFVTDFLSRAAVYDVAVDLVADVIEEDLARPLVEEVVAEAFFENFLEVEVILPEVKQQSRDVIKEVCDEYNDKKRRRDIRQVRRDLGDKVLDSLQLDYLLLLFAKQGRIWTETEHIDKQLDGA